MKQFELISVVVITYREFSYIYETIDSILQQDYPNIEIVITDDASPDFPEKELHEYIKAHKNENISSYKIVANQKNGGTVKNINIGIKQSTGKFIKIIAGDDAYYDEHAFSSQYKKFEKEPELMIVTGKTCECDAVMKPIYKEQVENTNKALRSIFTLEPKKYFEKCRKEHLFPLVTQALMIRREFFDKYGFYDERYRLLEDPPMEKRIITKKIPVGTVDNFIVKHRASVGISSNEQLFSNRQSQYFLDMANYVKNELLTRPEYFNPFRTKQQYKKELYRYKMSIAKTKKERLLLSIKNVDTALWFFFLNPSRAFEKVKILLRLK